jgi:serine phosphatase RsbU (regulator of sigma subunit)
LGLLATQDLGQPAARFGNVALACALAILASWTIEQRIRGIELLSRTQASIFASVPDGLAAIDANGTVLQFNDALHVLAPTVRQGHPLHAGLGHLLADGTPCTGGCALETGVASALLGDESITRGTSVIPVEYAVARVDDDVSVVSLRDVSAAKAAEENRLMLLEAAARQGEQEELLRALAPDVSSLPQVPGLMFDAYSAGRGPGESDVLAITALPDGSVFVMIVDAIGEGVLSARDAWKVLYIARASIEAGVRIDDVVARTSQILARDAGQPDVSMMLALIDPESGRLDLVGAGHPPALLIRGTGATEWLESASPAIGQRPLTATPITRQLLPHDSLVMYTDGVVDGVQDVIEGLATLRSSASALRKRPTEGWAALVTEAVRMPNTKAGSATMLLVRRDPVAG